jgi:hypothetical protein
MQELLPQEADVADVQLFDGSAKGFGKKRKERRHSADPLCL